MFGMILAGAGLALATISGISGANKAKQAGRMNAALIREETEEESRRMLNDIKTSEGMSAALSAASGVQVSGSRELSIESVKKENKAQLDWLKKSGEKKAQIAAKGGQFQSSQIRSQTLGNVVSGAASMYNNYSTPVSAPTGVS
jgi:hypothetical protein